MPENTPGLLNNRHNPIDNQVNWYLDKLDKLLICVALRLNNVYS